jgi:hypothetical protein
MTRLTWLPHQRQRPQPGSHRAASLSGLATYGIHNHAGDDLGRVQHPAPNVEPGDVVMLEDGREALVTARVETETAAPLAALLEVVVMSERPTR